MMIMKKLEKRTIQLEDNGDTSSTIEEANGVTTVTHKSPSTTTTISSNHDGASYTTIINNGTTKIIKSTPIQKKETRQRGLSSGIDDNKILQWVCCECGLAHGSIIYNSQHQSNLTNLPPPPPSLPIISKDDSNTSLNEDESGDLISKVKFYSQLIYNRDYTASNDSILNNQYPNSPLQSPIYSDNDNNSIISNEEDLKIEEILLKPPSRFTCHRCYHMMCPYCLKIRTKDLD